MSLLAGLGPLSNRAPEYQNQNTLVFDGLGRLRYVPLSRRILALPLEILAEIFTHCLPDVDFITPNPSTAPLALCGVCHQWREVALSTPTLWSSLELILDPAALDKGPCQWDAYVYLCMTWLARARQAPLVLSLRLGTGLTRPECVRPILQAIAGMSAQWRIINFDPSLVDTSLLFPNTAAPPAFPILEKVTCKNNTQFTSLLPFVNAPRLREFHTYSYPIALHPDFPWAQITTFTARYASSASCFWHVLDRAINLVEGKFRFQLWKDPVIPSESPTSIKSLDHLQSLSVDTNSEEGTAPTPISVLRHLKTPALKRLTLRQHSFEPRPIDASAFCSWISQSAVRLHYLELSFAPVSSEPLIICLKALPSLVELQLQILRNVDFDPLFSQLTNSDFLPRVEIMHCQFSTASPSNPHVLARALRCRWDAVGITRLRTFWIFKWNGADYFEAIISELQQLQQEGMDLHYRG
ncbi:hypothetical protein R3P38DRAFT_2904988 [Favolaschia claudopus]|uniref:F-box domain-containing protein n=1 Tax=Favolaschia claudopus TaxID=2862362 RepID=A0AAW0CDT3_9AGAR